MSDDQPIENIPLSDRYNSSKIVGSDLDSLSYARMPVSSFGMSMLTSMGFYEGRGLGRNPENALHHPIEYVARHHRLGLGADPAPLLLKKMEKNGKNEVTSGASKRNGINEEGKNGTNENGEGKSQEMHATGKSNLGRGESVKIDNSQRKSKNYVNIGEKPIERKKRKIEVESRVEINAGKHAGLTGKIISMNEESKEVVIQLDLNEENVKVKREEIVLMEEDGREIVGVTKKAIHKERKERKKEKKLKWIMTGLRVRIISKKYHNGKFYNIKVSVNDILDIYSFTAVTKNGEVLYSLREKDVETLLPELESNIMIVKGEKKGQMAVLKSREKKMNKVIVQSLDNFEFFELTQDDVCECIL